jgi:hypothetical protein
MTPVAVRLPVTRSRAGEAMTEDDHAGLARSL